MSQVVFLMPRWNDPTELFLQRQIRMLADANILEAIIAGDAGAGVKSYGQIPVYGLSEQHLMKGLLRAGGRRLGFEWPSPLTKAEVLRRRLGSLRADTIYCHWGDYAVRFKQVFDTRHYRIFVHLHGFDTHDQLCPSGYRQELIALANRATIICNSKNVYNRVLNWGLPANNLIIKYLGVEVPPAPSLRKVTSEVTILHLGRLVDFKSPDRTIKAFEIARDRGMQGQLVIAGDGPLRVTCELLKARSKWRDYIKICGAVTAEEGARLFATADIFTLHSISGELTGQVEAFGVAPVEAMAAALPVVGCRIAGLLETVIDQVTGILVEPGDVDGQADALLRLAREPDLRHALGRAGWCRAKNQFSYEKERTELLRILGLSDRSTISSS